MFKRKTRRSREFERNNQVIDFKAAREERQKKRKALSKKAALSRRKAIQKNRRRTVYAAIMLAIIAVIGVSIFNIVSVRMQLDEALAEQAALSSEKKHLTEELSKVDNHEYVEQHARMLLRMIMPGEVLYVLPASPEDSGDEEEKGAENGQ